MNKKIVDESLFQSLEQLEIYLKDNVAGAFGGNHRSRKIGSSSEFADYREYIPGDDIRRIDWNIFSRFEKLFLKLFLDERQMHIKIYIDCSRSMDFGTNNKGVSALRLAVCLAYLSISSLDKVSIYALRGRKCEKVIEGIIGKESFYNSIKAIENVEFDQNSCISDAIMSSPTIGYGDGMSFIISDFMVEEDYKNAIGYLRNKHRDVTCIQILSDEEINPMYRGKTILYDSENSNKLFKRNITKERIKAYHMALEYIKKQLSDFCLSRGANYLFVSSSDSLDDIIINKAIQKEVIK